MCVCDCVRGGVTVVWLMWACVLVCVGNGHSMIATVVVLRHLKVHAIADVMLRANWPVPVLLLEGTGVGACYVWWLCVCIHWLLALTGGRVEKVEASAVP